MSKVKVPAFGTPTKAYTLDTAATRGAVFGENLVWPDGRLVVLADLQSAPGQQPNASPTRWRLVREVPRNVKEVEVLASAGLVVRQASGDWITRLVVPTIGRTTVSNGDGAAGNIIIDLAVVPDSGIGELLALTRDSFGRVTGTRAPTTDDLPEGGIPTSPLYFTNARAVAALETWDDGPDYLQLLLDEYDPP